MKGVIKCSKFLALFAMPLLCLFQSSDVSAYKYNLDVIPFTVYNNTYGIGPTAQLLYQPLSFDSSEPFSTISKNIVYFNLREENGSCIYDSWHYANYGVTNPNTFYIPAYLQPATEYNQTSQALCNADGPISNIDDPSLPPYILGYPDFRGLLPYRYDYNGAFLRDSNTEDGLNVRTKLELSDLFVDNQIPDSFTSIDLPLGYSELEFPAGTKLTFTGKFYFDSDIPDTSIFTLGQTASVSIQASLYADAASYRSNSGNVAHNESCQSLVLQRNTNPDEAPYVLTYQCFVNITSGTSRISGFTLKFRGDATGQTNNPLWTYPNTYRIYFDQSYVVTNDDWTPAPTNQRFQANTISGNFQYNAPGAAKSYPDVESDGVNWSSSLRDLFLFSIINPFAPLFNLFNDQNSCQQIPTIASMIHSDETQVCPWFDSTTRNIVTPVLGLASVMLIFGFAVHWLGARSGNMFEDSVQTDNYSFSSKFRRKK